MTKKLGKIESVRFGHVGCQDVGLGIAFSFSFDGSGVCDSRSYWDAELVDCSEHCKWTENNRDAAYSDIMRYISKLLADAKVDDLSELKNKPVEVAFEGNVLKSWRILTEVL